MIADDTALPKQGQHSAGVKRQHCGVLGKQAICQVLVSLTLARKEVPMPVTLRLYLPEDWAQDPTRRAAAKVPESLAFATKGEIALAQLEPYWPTARASAWCWPMPALAVRQLSVPG